MDNFVIGNMIWNGGLVTVAAFLFKRWMDRTELTITTNRADAKHENQEKHDDLKERIASNKQFYSDAYKDLKKDIEVIASLQRVANGRTSSLETEVRTQVELYQKNNAKTKCKTKRE